MCDTFHKIVFWKAWKETYFMENPIKANNCWNRYGVKEMRFKNLKQYVSVYNFVSVLNNRVCNNNAGTKIEQVSGKQYNMLKWILFVLDDSDINEILMYKVNVIFYEMWMFFEWYIALNLLFTRNTATSYKTNTYIFKYACVPIIYEDLSRI